MLPLTASRLAKTSCQCVHYNFLPSCLVSKEQQAAHIFSPRDCTHFCALVAPCYKLCLIALSSFLCFTSSFPARLSFASFSSSNLLSILICSPAVVANHESLNTFLKDKTLEQKGAGLCLLFPLGNLLLTCNQRAQTKVLALQLLRPYLANSLLVVKVTLNFCLTCLWTHVLLRRVLRFFPFLRSLLLQAESQNMHTHACNPKSSKSGLPQNQLNQKQASLFFVKFLQCSTSFIFRFWNLHLQVFHALSLLAFLHRLFSNHVHCKLQTVVRAKFSVIGF